MGGLCLATWSIMSVIILIESDSRGGRVEDVDSRMLEAESETSIHCGWKDQNKTGMDSRAGLTREESFSSCCLFF